MIGWTKLEEGSETIIYPPQKRKSRKNTLSGRLENPIPFSKSDA